MDLNEYEDVRIKEAPKVLAISDGDGYGAKLCKYLLSIKFLEVPDDDLLQSLKALLESTTDSGYETDGIYEKISDYCVSDPILK